MIGISSACYYPLKTEEAFRDMARINAGVTEVFFNTYSEITPEFTALLKSCCKENGLIIDSVHPYTSYAEPYYFFSTYERRYNDGIELYKFFFHSSAALGARFFNFHGALLNQKISAAEYAERLLPLINTAKAEGITLCQENVSRCLCGQPDYITEVSDLLGSDISFTFDVKQAHRAGFDPFIFIPALKEKIKLVHISDRKAANECLLPCCGDFDFIRLRDSLKESGCIANLMIEVYSSNYKHTDEIGLSLNKLRELFSAGKV